jgi:A/G-specific adenine glycosylase
MSEGYSVAAAPCEGTEILVDKIRRRVIEREKQRWSPYPWRVDRTPYKVLIAEVLLKRTTRQAVAKEFPKLIAKYPDIESLYKAPIEEVEDMLRHLGLYRQRARHLKELAKVIVERFGGKVPNRWEDLAGLPGVGPYIAGAVLSFGYGKPAPVVDSNVIRLLGRLLGIKSKRYEDYVRAGWRLVPGEEHDYFNYGLIDLGALVCSYRGPKCGECPLRDVCVEYNERVDRARAECLKSAYSALTTL